MLCTSPIPCLPESTVHGEDALVSLARTNSNLNHNLTYGEILPESVCQHILPQLGDLSEDDVFYDLGSGTCKIPLQIAMFTPVAKSKGVEFARDRHVLAEQALAMAAAFKPASAPAALFNKLTHPVRSDICAAAAECSILKHPAAAAAASAAAAAITSDHDSEPGSHTPAISDVDGTPRGQRTSAKDPSVRGAAASTPERTTPHHPKQIKSASRSLTKRSPWAKSAPSTEDKPGQVSLGVLSEAENRPANQPPRRGRPSAKAAPSETAKRGISKPVALTPLAAKAVQAAAACLQHAAARTSAVHGDFIKEDLSDATVVFINNAVFEPDLMQALLDKLTSLPKLRRIVCLRKLCYRHGRRCELRGSSCAAWGLPIAEGFVWPTWTHETTMFTYTRELPHEGAAPEAPTTATTTTAKPRSKPGRRASQSK